MVQQISVGELHGKMQAGEPVFLLDVRRPDEHETAKIQGSVLIPLDEILSRTDEIEPAEGAVIVAYCHHGVRSLSAAVLLERAGFQNVVSLRGGIDAWSREIDPSIPRY
jgi:adenylyltransferase/sulfurtransferase